MIGRRFHYSNKTGREDTFTVIILPKNDDFQVFLIALFPMTWVYIIVAIVLALIRAFNKSSQAPRKPVDDRPSTASGSPSKTNSPTFEDLLREFTEAKIPKTSPTPSPVYSPPKPVNKSPYVDYDDDLKNEEEDLEDVNYDYRKEKRSYYESYEAGRKEAFNRPSLEETLKLEQTEPVYGKFKEFDKERSKTVLDEYVKELRTPSGFKKAIVLSEILKPRF